MIVIHIDPIHDLVTGGCIMHLCGDNMMISFVEDNVIYILLSVDVEYTVNLGRNSIQR